LVCVSAGGACWCVLVRVVRVVRVGVCWCVSVSAVRVCVVGWVSWCVAKFMVGVAEPMVGMGRQNP
jgi:hypothetical protein